jgi:DNA-binding transcriptional LysR family regulator
LWGAATPELRHLRVFLAVAEARNFTRAAERLHLAQQAVSKSVSQLERELGVELLRRTTREVRLTEAGRALADEARAIVTAADAAFARARARGQGLAGALAIGATPAVGPAVLDRAARALRAEAPELSVDVREVRPGEVGAALREGRVEVVLARTARPSAGARVVELAPTPAVLVVPAGHRLAGRAGAPLSAIDGERLLTWSPPGTPFTDLLVATCARAGARVVPVESAVTGGVGLPDLAPLGAVALMPEGTPAGAAVAVPLEEPVVLPLVAVHAAAAPSPAVSRLIELLGGRRAPVRSSAAARRRPGPPRR